ncbi:MAG: hypothetical protein JKY03_12500 [Aureispira sp.]|nr:hypothetical protein [Aureispira sp.]
MKNEHFSYRQSCFAMAVFGCTAFILGLVTILYPSYMINALNLSESDTAGLRSTIALNGIASTNMGAYYLYMVYHKVVPFFKATVIFRLLVTVPVILYWYFVHGQDSFLSIALWEAVGALWVFGALWYDTRRLGVVG